MTGATQSHEKLLGYWKQRLSECEAAAVEGHTTFGWLWRLKARVYRFLLARYSAGDWRSDATEPGARQPLVVREPLPTEASPPKATERIAATLGRVHDSAPAFAPGTYQTERGRELWYPGAKLPRDQWQLRWVFVKGLKEREIPYRIEQTRASCLVQVHAEDQEYARELLAALLQELADKGHLSAANSRSALKGSLLMTLWMAVVVWCVSVAVNLLEQPYLQVVLLTLGLVLGVVATLAIRWWARRIS